MKNDEKINVLFVCIHNSARSQMAESFLQNMGKDSYHVESAGIEPGQLNPRVVQVMAEIGFDISDHTATSVFDVLESGKSFDYVITVCDETSGERCPVFPGKTKRLHWNFKDPSAVQGTEQEKLEQIRHIRDEIAQRIKSFIEEKA